LVPHFEYFLSYGIPRKLEGQRYKKSPEPVKEHVQLLSNLFELWHRGSIFDCLIFFTRHLTGLNHSGLHAKLRQNNCLKQKPDNDPPSH
jgi:hypothetical protein